MCFHCGSVYRTKFDNIINKKIETDGNKDRETQTVTETVRGRDKQIQK